MYTLNEDQIKSVKTFIGKMPDSMVKSHYEKWLGEVEPTKRVTSEQLEKFVSFSNSLLPELQNYPQSFAYWLKNGVNTEKMESSDKNMKKANIGSDVDKSISKVEDVKAPENKETTLHKLGTKEKVKK
jgi:hypothetical protein